MQAAQTPESAEIDLTGHEGKAIMVNGHNGDGWIYSAEVIERAEPILTAVVRQVFGQACGLNVGEENALNTFPAQQ